MSDEDFTTDEHGYEGHPAFGLIGASRGQANPGRVLFDSDLRHQNLIRIRVQQAVRKRDLHHDWIGARDQIVELEMSEAQWASFVSTMNVGDGVPCTIRRIGYGEATPELPFAPRLAETMAETHDAAEDAFRDIRDALAEYEALVERKAPMKEQREALRMLHARVANATPNVDFAGRQLVKHAEDVVQRARADIESFVVTKATQLGLDPGEFDTFPALGSGETGETR